MPKPKKKYFVACVQEGEEVRVRKQIKRKAKIEGSQKIGRILICKHLETTVKGGVEITKRVKSYPGYLIIHCIYDNDSFGFIKSARGFISMLMSNTNPVAMETEEAACILIQQQAVNRPIPKKKPKPFQLPFAKGDLVSVFDGGAFHKLEAKVVKIDYPLIDVEVVVLGQPITQTIRWHYLKPISN
jgi:transcription antitermination factor NusG